MKKVELRKYFSGSVVARLVTSILLFIALSNLTLSLTICKKIFGYP